MTTEDLSRLIGRCLRDEGKVEIDGLGIFSMNGDGRIRLRRERRPRIFIAYAAEDFEAANSLYDALEQRGYCPWLDRRKLMPGQNWPRRIEEEIQNADFFIACFSSLSVRKRGGFQSEIRYALDCARRLPLDDVFFIPVRLDACRVPARIQYETQYVDLFPDRNAGLDRICAAIDEKRDEKCR